MKVVDFYHPPPKKKTVATPTHAHTEAVTDGKPENIVPPSHLSVAGGGIKTMCRRYLP